MIVEVIGYEPASRRNFALTAPAVMADWIVVAPAEIVAVNDPG